MARGGWANLPQVVWEDRSEVTFSLSEGILSSISMGILFNAKVLDNEHEQGLLVRRREGPMTLDIKNNCMYLKDWPVTVDKKKTFIYKYERDHIQKKVYGKRIHGIPDQWDDNKELPSIQIYEDKALKSLADPEAEYIIEYYYQYKDPALIYRIQK